MELPPLLGPPGQQHASAAGPVMAQLSGLMQGTAPDLAGRSPHSLLYGSSSYVGPGGDTGASGSTPPASTYSLVTSGCSSFTMTCMRGGWACCSMVEHRGLAEWTRTCCELHGREHMRFTQGCRAAAWWCVLCMHACCRACHPSRGRLGTGLNLQAPATSLPCTRCT